VYRMTHSIARAAVPHAEFSTGTPQKKVVIGIPEILLNKVVVYVLGGQLGFNTRQAHSLKLEHHQRAGGVLSEGLVNPEPDFLVRFKMTRKKVTGNELLSQISGSQN